MGGRSGKTLRAFLQANIRHEDVLKAVQRGLDSEDEREQLAAAKVVLGELVENQERPADEVSAPVEYDYAGIVATLEEIGVVMVQPCLAKFTGELAGVWEVASSEERELFVAEAARLSG